MSMCRRSTPGCVDANQPDLQSSRPGRDPGIIQPATPSTTEFNNHESLFCEFNRPQCGGPPRDIRVPIRGDRNSLHSAGSITEDLRKEFGVDENAEKVCEQTRRRLEAIDGVAPDRLLGVETGIVVEEGARASHRLAGHVNSAD